MSQSEVERFARDVASDAGLRAEVTGDGRLASAVTVAKRRGYDVTLDELQALAETGCAVGDPELSPTELAAMSGGAAVPEPVDRMGDAFAALMRALRSHQP
ncbi:hypothetical protein BH11PSE3_BH11PSE3_21980 [soil metagenome]